MFLTSHNLQWYTAAGSHLSISFTPPLPQFNKPEDSSGAAVPSLTSCLLALYIRYLETIYASRLSNLETV